MARFSEEAKKGLVVSPASFQVVREMNSSVVIGKMKNPKPRKISSLFFFMVPAGEIKERVMNSE